MGRKNKAEEVPADIYELRFKKSKSTSRGQSSKATTIPFRVENKNQRPKGQPAEPPTQLAPDEVDLSDHVDDEFDYVPDFKPSQGTTQNEYLEQFLRLEPKFLEVLLSSYQAPRVPSCSFCRRMSARWRCKDCHLHPFVCRGCLRGAHAHNPLHRIEKWTGRFFMAAEMWEVGVRVAFGHQGLLCPSVLNSLQLMEQREKQLDQQEQLKIERFAILRGANLGERIEDTLDNTDLRFHPGPSETGIDPDGSNVPDTQNDAHEEHLPDDQLEWEDETEEIDEESHEGIAQEDSFGTPFATIIHTNGVHRIPVVICGEEHQSDAVMDPFYVGYFPASFKETKTYFTSAVLDDFRVQNLECKTTPYGYFQVLRRKTNPLYPKSVPNRYAELRRVSRQWRKLKKLKWHGFGHEPRAATLGDLATFCANCPQPGVNLPDNWKEDPDQNLYLRSFVADGNFSADHLKQKRPDADVWLLNGRGMMTPRNPYLQHLAVAKETRSNAPCDHNFRVLQLINLIIAMKDATGIVAIACARHGCYAPSSVVDLQKGERQANVDWAFTQALKTTNINGLLRVLLIYDIVCQYHIHFQDRINVNDYLVLPDNVTIDQAIGLFHVHGHKDECFFRFATSFIPGAAIVDGEVLETLWSTLNNISPSTRTATLAHREEILDDHMNDSNMKKIFGSVDSIIRKYKTAVKSCAASQEYFRRLTAAATRRDASLVPKWEAAIAKAEVDRLKKPSAMDVMNTALPKPPTKAQKQVQLAEAAQTSLEAGSVNAMVLGLKLEEEQFELEAFIKKKGAYPTRTDRLDIAKKRDKLRGKIEKYQLDAARLIGDDITNDITGDREPTSDDYDSHDADDYEGQGPKPLPGTLPELTKLPFPSAIPTLRRDRLGLSKTATYELELRIGQANDSLQAIRLAIGQKSFLYREGVRTAPRKQMILRSRGVITTLTQQIAHHCHVYNRCRKAMVALGMPQEQLDNLYKPISRQDLKTSTMVKKPNEPGHSQDQLSWIWTTQVGPSTESASNHLTEFYRVHWLRGRAQSHRWTEEKKLTSHEMAWTTRFFLNRMEQWNQWHLLAVRAHQAGACAYAASMIHKWKVMANNADKKFASVNPEYVMLAT